jgi:large subunit ribosomal protein L18e
MKRLNKNLDKKEIIVKLYNMAKSKKKDIYASLAKELEKSSRLEVRVNLGKMESLKYIKDGDIVVVPGKVLGTGLLNKNITIYSYSVSKVASEKLKNNVKNLMDFCNDDINYKVTKIIK